MKGKVVITTAIPGSKTSQFLDRFKKYAKKRGKDVVVFEPGDVLIEHGERIGVEFTEENILNSNKKTLNAVRSSVFENFLPEAEKILKRGGIVVVKLHSYFYWKYRYISAFDHYYLEKLNPSLFVHFLDNVDGIMDELRHRSQWDWFMKEDGVLQKVLEWQSIEMESTRNFAQRGKDNFFVIPSRAHESILYRVLFEPWRKVIYLGMPLTLLSGDKYKEARKRIDDLKDWLSRYVVVVDPRYVEPLTKEHLEVINPPMYHNVVARDLDWLIPQCGGMVAFFPVVAFSAGVNNEMREVHENNNDVFLIYPKERPASPFVTEWANKGVFPSENEFKESFLVYLGDEYLAQMEEAEKGYTGEHNG